MPYKVHESMHNFDQGHDIISVQTSTSSQLDGLIVCLECVTTTCVLIIVVCLQDT